MASLCSISTRERENLWALWSCASNGWTGELGSGGRVVKFKNQPCSQAESWSCQKVVEEKSSATSCEREARVLQELSQEKVGKVIVPPRLRLGDTAQWKAFAVPCQFYSSKSNSAVQLDSCFTTGSIGQLLLTLKKSVTSLTIPTKSIMT